MLQWFSGPRHKSVPVCRRHWGGGGGGGVDGSELTNGRSHTCSMVVYPGAIGRRCDRRVTSKDSVLWPKSGSCNHREITHASLIGK